MAKTTPIERGVCNLEPTELSARLAMIRGDVLAHVTRRERVSRELVLEFRGDPGMRGRLERLVDLERQCCSSLNFRLQELPGDGFRLSIRGPDTNALNDLEDILRAC